MDDSALLTEVRHWPPRSEGGSPASQRQEQMEDPRLHSKQVEKNV